MFLRLDLADLENKPVMCCCTGGVAQVFIHDPLYKWGLTLGQKQHRQRDEGGNALPAPAAAADAREHTVKNADAERTVLRVREKLLGTEAGTLPALPLSALAVIGTLHR